MTALFDLGIITRRQLEYKGLLMARSYYTVNEVAKIMDVHTTTVRNWIKRGELQAIKCARTIRIPKKRINKWIKKIGRKYYTIGEVAYLLGVDESTVRRWVKERRLQAVRCGNAIRILADRVDKWVEELK